MPNSCVGGVKILTVKFKFCVLIHMIVIPIVHVTNKKLYTHSFLHVNINLYYITTIFTTGVETKFFITASIHLSLHKIHKIEERQEKKRDIEYFWDLLHKIK